MKKKSLVLLGGLFPLFLSAQHVRVTSPDGNLQMEVNCAGELSYSLTYHGKKMIHTSPMGFEFKDEKPMRGEMELLNNPEMSTKRDSWIPIVKNKHEKVSLTWNEAVLELREKEGDMRRMDIHVRAYDNGVAFRYRLYGGRKLGSRKLTRELTGFAITDTATVWMANHGWYTSSQENEYFRKPIKEIAPSTIGGLPLLVEVNKHNYLAITEAHIDNYPGFYIGAANLEKKNDLQLLNTKLSPLPGEPEEGVKALFATQTATPWRVVMVADNPGKFIESEIIHGLNPPCAIEETSWIKPGMSAWDHWWSGEVKMETDVIKEYIDLAAQQGWPYMLIDWQWYGPFNTPEADITRPAPQLNMPEILAYARERNVRCWLWLYCTDANKNDSYIEAFKLYEQWGIAGVKIDFMDRDDQEMVNWYRRIVQTAAKHKLLVNFHGAYKPDGIDRTYPNLLTREGVFGEEQAKMNNRLTPEHNVTLAFTRMLAGQMDYTPGGFLNVTQEAFKQQTPTLVPNTRCAELSKFVIYDSPFTVACEHPRNLLGQPGADFLKLVPTVWDDTRFIDGYPDEYIVLAKRSGKQWFVGAMNNSKQRTIKVNLSFLPQGKYQLEYWADAKNANKEPTGLVKKTVTVDSRKPLTVKMANAGGYAAIITPIEQ